MNHPGFFGARTFGANRASSYADVALETGIAGADPHKLILMLFDGASLALANAERSIQQADVAAKGKSISKAMEIISMGLKASLDMRAGGEIAQHLSDLYDYMCQRLVLANLHHDAVIVAEVRRLLGELRDAWSAIGSQHAGTAQAHATQAA